MSILDPFHIRVRSDELKSLENGWLDGKGLAPSHQGLDWLAGEFDRLFPDDLPLPYLYPTPEGGVRAEWSIRHHELSLEINLSARVGAWHSLNVDDDDEASRELDLKDSKAWEWFAKEIRLLLEANG